MLGKATFVFCLLLVVLSTMAAAFEQDTIRPYSTLKRGSLSNMMRIGKRQMSQQQDFLQFPNEGQVPCESCNLGTLMRIGRR
ncbi:unnamed protein product [Caenorhabditis sp. 36 PRJEB53466]|nr:unnamed protein product [Caenorhabditis sp. 36 PRJEB53466]